MHLAATTYALTVDRPALFSRVAGLLHSELGDYQRLEGGSSADVWQVELITAQTARWVVIRTHRGNSIKQHDAAIATKEFRLLRELWTLKMAVAEPLLVIESEATLVTAFVPGSAEVTNRELESALDQMVGFLVDLHRIDPGTVTIDELAELEDPIALLPHFLPSTDLGDEVRAVLAAGHLDPQVNGPVVIHGDYWPGNVLWNDGQLAAVIDWEDAAIGDPLADLAGARVELLCQYDAAAMRSFTTRYLTTVDDLDTGLLPLWECYVSATALASMHRWGLEPSEERRRRALTNQFFERAAADLLAEAT